MNQEFFSLTEDQYIVKLGKDTFTISRLQELIAIQFEQHIRLVQIHTEYNIQDNLIQMI